MTLNLIAREGNFLWQSDSDQAGPYHIGWTGFMFNKRSFGVVALKTNVQGSIAQREAFRQSKAAFACCRHFAEVLACGMPVSPERGIEVIKVAADSARAEYRRWIGQFGVYDKADDGYTHAVLDRFEASIRELVGA